MDSIYYAGAQSLAGVTDFAAAPIEHSWLFILLATISIASWAIVIATTLFRHGARRMYVRPKVPKNDTGE